MYTLQGVVGRSDFLADIKTFSGRCCLISQGLALVPLTEEVREEVGIPFLPLTDDGGALPESIIRLCSSSSRGGYIAYVESEIFGGSGVQASVVWHDTRLVAGPTIGDQAVNDALRALGVLADPGKDEFDTVGLGLHRRTDDWMRKGSLPP